MTTVAELEVVLRGDDSQLQRTFNDADNRFDSFVSGAQRNVIRGAAAAGGALLALGGFAVTSAIMWESSFADVRRTVDATDDELIELEDTLLAMATSPVFGALEDAQSTLAGIAATAGQLGIDTADIDEFVAAVAATGVATGLATDDIALFFGQFANVTGLDIATDIDNLADAIVHLGNNSATTEGQIIAFATRLGGLSSVGFAVDEILGWGTAMASMGINAESGGTAFTSTVNRMQKAARDGGGELATFAEVAGLTADEFAELALSDPSAAMEAFIGGLSELEGTEVPAVLDELGITAVRQRDAVIKLAAGFDSVTESLALAEEGLAGNGAAMTEASIKADTTAGNLNRLRNTATDLGITLGTNLLPGVNKVADAMTLWLEGDHEASISTLKDGAEDLATAIGQIVLGPDAVSFDEALAGLQVGLDGLGIMFELGLFAILDIIDDSLLTMKLNFLAGFLAIFESVPEEMRGLIPGFESALEGLSVKVGEVQADIEFDTLAEEVMARVNEVLTSGGQIEFSGEDVDLLLNPNFVAQLDPRTKGRIEEQIRLQITEAIGTGDAETVDALIPLVTAFEIDLSDTAGLSIGEQISEAIGTGDAEAIDMLLPLAAELDLDFDTILDDIAIQLAEAGETGDVEAIEFLLPLAAQFDMDLTSFTEDIELKLAEAILAGDVQAINVLMPIVTELDIDANAVMLDAQDIVNDAIESGTYNATVAVNMTLTAGSIDRSQLDEAIASGGGGGGGGGGDTIILNSYGENQHEQVQQYETAQRDLGGGGARP